MSLYWNDDDDDDDGNDERNNKKIFNVTVSTHLFPILVNAPFNSQSSIDHLPFYKSVWKR